MTEDTTAKSMLPIKLSAAGWSFDTKISVPPGSTRIGDLLPLARTLSQSVVESSIQSVAENGRKVSCTKGCGACCRQLVAIPFAEAQTLAELVAVMPVERQAIIQDRFEVAIRRLEEAGLMDRKAVPGERALIANDCGSRAASLQDLSQRYFRLQIPCPFLENESCGIYEDRPLICREYHVTSPAQRCARLFDQAVDRVEVPIHLGDVMSRTGAELSRTAADSIPLVLALEWAKKNQESCEQRWNGETLWQTFVDELHAAAEAAVLRTSGADAKLARQAAASFSTAPLIVTKFFDSEGNANAESQTVKLSLLDSNWQMQTTLSVPIQSTDAAEFLPLARTIVDSVVDHAASSVEADGQKISCKAGCGACCRQLVPISAVEATKIRELIEAMPEPRRADVRARFAAARKRLEGAGLLDKLLERADWDEREVSTLGLNYFVQGIPCPFLENESCSIYAERPLACREYLVTSPAANCANPSAQTIDQVSLPFKVWPALARLTRDVAAGRFIPWVPLILAPEWAANVPPATSQRSGVELLRDFCEFIARIHPALDANTVGAIAQNIAAQAPLQPSHFAAADSDSPLRLGRREDFARVRAFFLAARFDQATILRIFEIGDMSDVGSVKRNNFHITGILGLCVRLFLFVDTVPKAEVEQWIDAATLQSMLELDLLRVGSFDSDETKSADKYYSPVWLYPVGDFLIASDRGKNPDGSNLARKPDVVFPAIYEGTLRFLRMLPQGEASDGLDLCSGTGIAALTIGKDLQRVIAADITARAGHFAQFNAQLNGCDKMAIACGDLYGAVGDRMFDRILAHPPFVPSSSDALIYRDSGRTGEDLTKRIVEGLPDHLRAGGWFCMVCSAWDTTDGLFEDRLRVWLGERNDEFDIIFALHRELTPDVVARQLPEIRESADPAAINRWTQVFRAAGCTNSVYGAILMRRKSIAADNDVELPPITRRVHLGELTDGNSFKWAQRWYRWRQLREAAGDLAVAISAVKPRLSPDLKLTVSHEVRDGSFALADTVLESRWPFPAKSRVDAWMAQMFGQFDGQRTTREVYQDALQSLAVPASFQLENFAALVVTMVERGHLLVDDALLEG